VLEVVPISPLENRRLLLIHGNFAMANGVIKLWGQKHNVCIGLSLSFVYNQDIYPPCDQPKPEIEYRPTKELDDRVNANADDHPCDSTSGVVIGPLRAWREGQWPLP
jgi:hypothetical protein